MCLESRGERSRDEPVNRVPLWSRRGPQPHHHPIGHGETPRHALPSGHSRAERGWFARTLGPERGDRIRPRSRSRARGVRAGTTSTAASIWDARGARLRCE